MKVGEGGCCDHLDQWCKKRLSDPETPGPIYLTLLNGQAKVIVDTQQSRLAGVKWMAED